MTNQEKTREVAPRRDPFNLSDMRAEMDRLWDAMTSRSPFLSSVTRFQQPAIDVFEKDGQLHVRAEVPGMAPEDIQIEVAEDALLISGEKKEEKEVKEENYYRSERSYGKFTRRIPLPRTADTDKANARFKDGVLEIDMPVKNGGGAKKIQIQK
jgi:HSP20 family protein